MTNLAHLPPTVNELIIIEELWRDEYEIGYLACATDITTGPSLCTIKYIDAYNARYECKLCILSIPSLKTMFESSNGHQWSGISANSTVLFASKGQT